MSNDHQVLQDLNKLLELGGKRIRSKERVAFLERCLEYHVTPTFIRDRVSKTKPKWPTTIEKAFLRDELGKERDFLRQVGEEYTLFLLRMLRCISLFDRI